MSKLLMLIVCIYPFSLRSQVMDLQGMYKLCTPDKLDVFVMPGFDDSGAHTYYYLPANLRLSTRTDKTNEFSFMTYDTKGIGQPDGAILHMLFVWGLMPKQEKEIQSMLQSSIDSLAVLAGAVNVEVPMEGPSVSILGDSPLAKLLRTKWSREPVAPVIPGTKIALSYKLEGSEVQLFQDALDHPEKLDSIQVELKFQFEGGYKNLWYSKFQENTYSLRVSLHQILEPVLPKGQIKKK